MSLGRPLRTPAAVAAGALLVIAAGFALAHRLMPSWRTLPDVVLLTVDTLRSDRLGAYGHAAARTPNVDRLAAGGTLFTEATTPLPRTTPALATLLSGLRPPGHGSREVGQQPREVPFLAEILKRLGYLTVGVSSNGSVGRAQGFDRGFDRFVDADELRRHNAEVVTQKAVELLPHGRLESPFFLWVHYTDPHFPYRVPRGWPEPPGAGPCAELVASLEGRRRLVGHLTNDRGGRASRALESCYALYDTEVAFTDHHLGELLAALDGLGRRRQRLVVFTADHGENFGEDGLFYQHGPNVHDASLKVPLVISGPGVARHRDDGVARLEDVLPTLLRLLGLPRYRWPEVDGEDLSRRLEPGARAASGDRRMALAESGSALLVHSYRHLHSGRTNELHCLNGERFSLCGRPGEEPGLYDHLADPDLETDLSDDFPEETRRLSKAREVWPPESARERAVRTRRFKLVERPRLEGGYRRFLYDLRQDPLAKRDSSLRHPEVVARLGRALDRFTADLPAFRAALRSDEQVRALRALGYVD